MGTKLQSRPTSALGLGAYKLIVGPSNQLANNDQCCCECIDINFFASIDWDVVVDLDLYVKGPDGQVCFYGTSETDSLALSLNHDAYAGCDEGPLPPEEIAGHIKASMTQTFYVWYMCYSVCALEEIPTPTQSITILNNSTTNTIYVNGTAVSPGDEWASSEINYGGGGANPEFTGGTKVEVTCTAPTSLVQPIQTAEHKAQLAHAHKNCCGHK
jgi:hypothetical protein